MAAEVRTWILEMGSQRDHIAINQTSGTMGDSSSDLTGYLVAARVLQARPAVLSSSGAFSFVRAEKVTMPLNEGHKKRELLNIMVMGPSRSKPPSQGTSSQANGPRAGFVKEGDLLAIHRGLAWHVAFDEYQALVPVKELQTGPRQDGDVEQWLIAMEWDLIEEAM